MFDRMKELIKRDGHVMSYGSTYINISYSGIVLNVNHTSVCKNITPLMVCKFIKIGYIKNKWI